MFSAVESQCRNAKRKTAKMRRIDMGFTFRQEVGCSELMTRSGLFPNGFYEDSFLKTTTQDVDFKQTQFLDHLFSPLQTAVDSLSAEFFKRKIPDVVQTPRLMVPSSSVDDSRSKTPFVVEESKWFKRLDTGSRWGTQEDLDSLFMESDCLSSESLTFKSCLKEIRRIIFFGYRIQGPNAIRIRRLCPASRHGHLGQMDPFTRMGGNNNPRAKRLNIAHFNFTSSGPTTMPGTSSNHDVSSETSPECQEIEESKFAKKDFLCVCENGFDDLSDHELMLFTPSDVVNCFENDWSFLKYLIVRKLLSSWIYWTFIGREDFSLVSNSSSPCRPSRCPSDPACESAVNAESTKSFINNKLTPPAHLFIPINHLSANSNLPQSQIPSSVPLLTPSGQDSESRNKESPLESPQKQDGNSNISFEEIHRAASAAAVGLRGSLGAQPASVRLSYGSGRERDKGTNSPSPPSTETEIILPLKDLSKRTPGRDRGATPSGITKIPGPSGLHVPGTERGSLPFTPRRKVQSGVLPQTSTYDICRYSEPPGMKSSPVNRISPGHVSNLSQRQNSGGIMNNSKINENKLGLSLYYDEDSFATRADMKKKLLEIVINLESLNFQPPSSLASVFLTFDNSSELISVLNSFKNILDVRDGVPDSPCDQTESTRSTLGDSPPSELSSSMTMQHLSHAFTAMGPFDQEDRIKRSTLDVNSLASRRTLEWSNPNAPKPRGSITLARFNWAMSPDVNVPVFDFESEKLRRSSGDSGQQQKKQTAAATENNNTDRRSSSTDRSPGRNLASDLENKERVSCAKKNKSAGLSQLKNNVSSIESGVTETVGRKEPEMISGIETSGDAKLFSGDVKSESDDKNKNDVSLFATAREDGDDVVKNENLEKEMEPNVVGSEKTEMRSSLQEKRMERNQLMGKMNLIAGSNNNNEKQFCANSKIDNSKIGTLNQQQLNLTKNSNNRVPTGPLGPGGRNSRQIMMVANLEPSYDQIANALKKRESASRRNRTPGMSRQPKETIGNEKGETCIPNNNNINKNENSEQNERNDNIEDTSKIEKQEDDKLKSEVARPRTETSTDQNNSGTLISNISNNKNLAVPSFPSEKSVAENLSHPSLPLPKINSSLARPPTVPQLMLSPQQSAAESSKGTATIRNVPQGTPRSMVQSNGMTMEIDEGVAPPNIKELCNFFESLSHRGPPPKRPAPSQSRLKPIPDSRAVSPTVSGNQRGFLSRIMSWSKQGGETVEENQNGVSKEGSEIRQVKQK